MISRYNAWIDGVALSSIHEDLYVRDIVQEAVLLQGTHERLAKGPGSYFSPMGREMLRVSIEFELHIYEPVMRQAVCSSIVSWASGRVLKTSDRPGQELHVICTELPGIQSALRWTDTMAVGFTAYECPYWISDYPVTGSVNSGGKNIYVPGNVPAHMAKAKVDAVVTATETTTSLRVSAESKSIYLSGINIAAGETVVFSHDENGILSIKTGTTSLLDKRTAGSMDDLEATCGKIDLFSSNRKCDFSIRGMWL